METEQNFEVLISKELDDKINWLTDNYDKEIGAWLIGEITNEKIIIEDFLIPNQDVSGASVDTSGKALVQLRKEYGDRCKKIIGHFHSHNTMGASWSATDDEFMELFTAPRERAVFIVSSQRENHRIMLKLTKPFKISLDELEYKILYDNSKISEELNKIIKEKVEEKEVKSDFKVIDWDDDTPPVTEELTKREISQMITFCNKTNNVYVKNLSLYQYYQMENVFPVETEVFNIGNAKVTIQYKTRTKEKAIELMKDLREYMREEFKEKESDYLDYDDYGNYRGVH